LLAQPDDVVAVREAEVFLDEVDLLLEVVVGDERTDADVARLLKSLRDDLGGHVVAASALEAIAMPSGTVANVLNRGVVAAAIRLASLAWPDVRASS
jgi:hypothetical protein